MKRLLTCICLTISLPVLAQVGVGTTTPSSSAQLDVNSTTKGFLPPRMTLQQRNAIVNPEVGLTIYNTTSDCLNFYRSGGWYDPCASIAAAAGNQALNKLVGGNSNDYPSEVHQTSDGGFIISGTSWSSANGDVSGVSHGSSDFWIVKLDALGNIQWNKLIGGSGTDEAVSISQTPDGGYIVVGNSNSSLSGDVMDTSHGGQDIWLVKLNANGDILWNKLLGGSSAEMAFCIRNSSFGGYILSAQSSSTNSGDVTGAINGVSDFWVVRLDISGNVIWNRLAGGGTGSTERGSNIIQVQDGGYIVCGSSNAQNISATTQDYCVIKLDTAGTVKWTKLIGGSGNDRACRIAQSLDGGYIIAGQSTSSNSGHVTDTIPFVNNNLWVAKLDTVGNVLWNNLLGGSGSEDGGEYGVFILPTIDGGYIVSSWSNSTQSGDVTGINHGLGDYWVLKLNSSGQVIWNRLLGGNQSEYYSAAALTSGGGCVIVGTSHSNLNGDVTASNHGNGDYWLIKLNAFGQIVQ